MFSLDNKVALVTGASRGLGAGIARCLAKAGADVVINYLNSEQKAMVVVDEIEALGRKSIAIKADVRKEDDTRRLFDSTLKEMNRLDIFVNNAGINGPEDIYDTSLTRWEELIETNLTSTFLCMKYAMEIMRKQRFGRIIIDASMVGQRGAQYGQIHYAASKGGQLAMTRTLARTAAPYNITVNAVAPGPIETEMLTNVHDPKKRAELAKAIPLGFGQVEDVGAAVVFFASDEARYITGATLDINGGMYMR